MKKSITLLFSLTLLVFFQNCGELQKSDLNTEVHSFEATQSISSIDNCSNNTNIKSIGWKKFPKLFFTAEQLGKAVACPRQDLKTELIQTAALLYEANKNKAKLKAVRTSGINARSFYNNAVGRSDEKILLSKQTNINIPGQARLIQRLASASFFVDKETAKKYRTFSKELLLHWANNTFKAEDMAEAKKEASKSTEHGLILGSNMVAFAGAFDLLAASGQFKSKSDRKTVVNWMRRVNQLIKLSNNHWMRNCVKGVPFSYDGPSCERAKGDNHITVGAAAVYVLGVMTGNPILQKRSIASETAFKWGYKDRLGTIIYNSKDQVASPDRFPTVHTGEIYDRWRGHYRERTRGLQLHRSFSYPYLSLSFLTVQALAAKRQGIDLMAPVAKANGKSISLEKSFLFYNLFLQAYNPGELMDPVNPKLGYGYDNDLPKITSALNYISLQDTYCVNGFTPLPTDEGCIMHEEKGLLVPGENDNAYTEGYYHHIFAGAHSLLKNTARQKSFREVNKVLTPEKMAFTVNAYSPHIIPFEPALLIQRD